MSLWEEATSLSRGVRLKVGLTDAIIYKGIKFTKNKEVVKVYNTETDMYKDITDAFKNGLFNENIKKVLRHRYVNKLKRIEIMIKNEMNGFKNHKRISTLKKYRENTLKKYNEISN
jgi:uncharacterized protein YutD